MKLLWAVVALVLSLAFVPSRAFADLPEPKGKKENANIVAARKAIEAKDFKTAVGHLTKAVQEEPKNADAHSMLGYSYRKVGTFDKSMEHYQTALKIDSSHRSAQEYLGELYLDMNQPENAEKQLATLKKACPVVRQVRRVRRSKKSDRRLQSQEKVAKQLNVRQSSRFGSQVLDRPWNWIMARAWIPWREETIWPRGQSADWFRERRQQLDAALQ